MSAPKTAPKAKKGPAGPTKPPPSTPDDEVARLSDLANAERLVSLFSGSLRFVAAWACWVWWDSTRWVREPARGGRAQEAAKKTARRIFADANAKLKAARAYRDSVKRAFKGGQTEGIDGRLSEAERDVEQAEFGSKAARRAQSVAGLQAMQTLATSDPRMQIDSSEFDRKPWLFNCANGTIDLSTGALLPHNREDLLTQVCPVNYDTAAKAPVWEKCLDQWMAGDADLVTFLQRMAGYMLTGSTREHALFFMFGDGANGKSTFTKALNDMMGPGYCIQAPRDLLFRQRMAGHPTEFARLYGVRCALCNEIEEGLSWDEARVKDLNSEDVISCRRMREDFWDFHPTHKLLISGNHLPQVGGADEGIWRRMRLIPWRVKVPKEDRDTALPDKLSNEIMGILAWAVSGCLDYRKSGLGLPRAIAEATEKYRQMCDTIGQFFESRLKKDPNGRVLVSEMRSGYEDFCDESGLPKLGGLRFNARLQSLGAEPAQGKVNGKKAKVWRGVAWS